MGIDAYRDDCPDHHDDAHDDDDDVHRDDCDDDDCMIAFVDVAV